MPSQTHFQRDSRRDISWAYFKPKPVTCEAQIKQEPQINCSKEGFSQGLQVGHSKHYLLKEIQFSEKQEATGLNRGL